MWSIERIDKELRKNPIILDEVDKNGYTALIYACKCYKNDKNFIKKIIESGVDVNKKSTSYISTTPLMVVSGLDDIEIAKFLIQNGANINDQNKSKDTALIIAVQEASEVFVKCLLDFGADIEIQNQYGETALMNAAARGSLEKAKLLIEAGANIDVKDGRGITAVMDALDYAVEPVIEYFINVGFDINALFAPGYEYDLSTHLQSYSSLSRYIENKVDTLSAENLVKWKSHRLKALFS